MTSPPAKYPIFEAGPFSGEDTFMPTSKAYNFSLTGVYLLIPVCLDLADLYEEYRDWELVKERVLADNLLQGQREETNKKRLRVLLERLRTITEAEWEIFFDGSGEVKRQLLLMAAARTHRIIREFVIEVVREKFLIFDTRLEATAFEPFWRYRVEQVPELEKITALTQRKIRNVIFNMLEDAGWIEGSLSTGFYITPPQPDTPLANELARTSPEWLSFFCLSDRDILTLIESAAEND